MKPSSITPKHYQKNPLSLRLILATAAFILGLVSSGHSQNRVGELAPDFTLPIWRGAESKSLSDYEGSIVVLDFFAYWCGPCIASSPDLEENVQEYYEALGGTPEGIPVHVIPINIEYANPSATDAFLENAGLEFALDDGISRSVYSYYSTGGIPLFVIINMVAGSPSHEQGEILHHRAGYSGSTYFRRLIELVQAGDAGGPEVELRGNGVDISNNDVTPRSEDGTHFGNVDYPGEVVSRNFRVYNSGDETLTLGTPTSSEPAFTVSGLVSSLPPGSSDEFTVDLDPSSPGIMEATIRIPTNDSNENPFSFSVTAFGVAPDDHGDSTEEATAVAANTSEPGYLSAGDSDYFAINLAGPGTLTVYTTGATDTYGNLIGPSGALLAGNDDSGSSRNFRIIHAIDSPGTYYVKVRGFNGGATGAYEFFASFASSGPDPEPDAWHEGASSLGGGWLWLDWLGSFNVSNDPWIYHAQHGWLFPFADGPENIYFWDSDMGSIFWTSESVYPSIYRFSDGKWLFYQVESSNPRWFVDLQTGQWEQW